MAKLTIQLNSEMEDVLGVLADQRGLPKTQVMRDAVRLMKYLDDAGRSADLVLRNRSDGTERHIVLESQLRTEQTDSKRDAPPPAPRHTETAPRGAASADSLALAPTRVDLEDEVRA